MGAPGVTWFCKNGHIVLDVPHYYIAEDPKICGWCGSTELACELEWGDKDYGPHRVSTTPVRKEKKRKTVYANVYDVSRLFKSKRAKDKKKRLAVKAAVDIRG